MILQSTVILIVTIVGLLFAGRVEFVAEQEGNSEIIAGNFGKAELLIRNYPYQDSAYLFLKLGEIAYQRGTVDIAKQYFSKAIQESDIYAPFAYRRIGDVELSTGKVDYAIKSYRAAAEKTKIEPYRFYLYSKIDSLNEAYEKELGTIGWVTLWHNTMASTPRSTKQYFNWKKLVAAKPLTEKRYNALLNKSVKSVQVSRFIKAIQDTSLITAPFSTKKIFSIAQKMKEYGHHKSASRWLHASLNRKDFAKQVRTKTYLGFRAELNYKLKNWDSATKWYAQYFKKYGYTPLYVYHMARSYRNQKKYGESGKWYTKHVNLYPKTARTYDILWYQAWREEEKGNFTKAIKLFTTLGSRYANKKHGDDAAFRVGLNQYRTGKYTEAVNSFISFRKRFGKSKLFAGSLYWQAVSYQKLKQDKKASDLFHAIVDKYPLNYYGWRSRQQLPDVPFPLIYEDSLTDSTWKKVITKISTPIKDSLWKADFSDNFDLALKLGTIGFYDEAEFILEPLEIRGERNYALMLEISRFYESIGYHYQAYRLAKKIYWALPRSKRTSLPRSFVTMLYPKVFENHISKSAETFSIEPALVRSIMRQESQFSVPIKSPVGAVGLMQIMPYTGKEIATDLKHSFRKSMLLNAKTNIHFGTYYIGKLLKQWKGDKIRSIASYNGGPHNVKRWVNWHKDILHDPIYFVECIGFSETRHYVKKVLENYWTYSALYPTVEPKKAEESSLVQK